MGKKNRVAETKEPLCDVVINITQRRDGFVWYVKHINISYRQFSAEFIPTKTHSHCEQCCWPAVEACIYVVQ